MNYTKNITSSETNLSQFAQCYQNEDLNTWDQLKSDFQKENYLLDDQYINKDICLKVNYIPSSRNDYFDDDVNYFNNDKNKNYFDQNEDNNEYYTGQKENGQLFNLMNSENFNFQDNQEEEMGLQIINSNHNQQENCKVLGNPMNLNFNQPMQNNQNNDINFNIDCQDSQTSNNNIQNQNDIIYNIPFNENNYEETQNIQLQSQQFMTQVQNQNEKQNYQSRDPIIKIEAISKIEEELGIKENKQQQFEESQNILSKKDKMVIQAVNYFNQMKNLPEKSKFKPNCSLIIQNLEKTFLKKFKANDDQEVEIQILTRKSDTKGKINSSKSSCQNMKKLIMIGILKFFQPYIIEKFSMIPNHLKEEIIKVGRLLKESGKIEVKKKIVKMDLFSQPHFNILFLSLNRYSCCSMCRNEQNILLHEQIFGVNISKFKEIDPVKLEYVNIIKSFMYLITKKFLEQESNTDNETVKDYKDRVIYSIKKMIEGQYLKKFQFYSSDSKQKNVKNIGQPKLPTKTQPKRKRKARN